MDCDDDDDNDGWLDEIEDAFGSDPFDDGSVPFAPIEEISYSRQIRGSGDVAPTCGIARFDWYQINISSSFAEVQQGDFACLLMFSNRASNEAQDIVFETGGSLLRCLVPARCCQPRSLRPTLRYRAPNHVLEPAGGMWGAICSAPQSPWQRPTECAHDHRCGIRRGMRWVGLRRGRRWLPGG